MRGFDRDLIRGGHYGQRPGVPRSKAEHMAAPTNAAGVNKVLANPEPSTHGPMYGPAVRCKRFSSIRQMRSCINVSDLCLERVVLRIIMDISAHSI